MAAPSSKGPQTAPSRGACTRATSEVKAQPPLPLAGALCSFCSSIVFENTTQSTVSVNALLVPPLEQPKSSVFPLGVITWTLTGPVPGITSVESFIVNSCLLTTVGLSGVELISTSVDETKLPPFTVSVAPLCTWARVMVLGEREAISGTGLALPQNGLRALLQARI